MIDVSAAILNQLVIHRVGNQSKDEGFFISNNMAIIDQPLSELLLDYFLNSFTQATETYQFIHNVDINMNVVYHSAKHAFEDPATAHEQSTNILRHLYDQSRHPHIKSGDLFVATFDNILLHDELVSAIGIFKSENKDSFITLKENDNRIMINKEMGIGTRRIDKGCLILETDMAEGYRLFSIDHNNYDADYWMRQFLGIDYIKDDNFDTKAYIDFCKSFSEEVVKEKLNKKGQIDFLNQSVRYLEQSETVDVEEFKNTVFGDEELKEDFDAYKKSFEANNNLEIKEKFEVSSVVLKKQKKKLQSLIQLDTGIKIKLDFQNTESVDRFIHKGYDMERGMQFYKVYFNTEK